MERIREAMPDRLRTQLADPAAVVLAVHGIESCVWTCPACERVYVAGESPPGRCECGRPLRRSCDSLRCSKCRAVYMDPCECVVCGTAVTRRDRCGGWVEPINDRGVWYHGGPHCADCVDTMRKQARTASYNRALARVADKLALARSGSYLAWDHRSELDTAGAAWIESNCGRDANPPRPWVVVWGCTGSGKTIGLIRYAGIAYVQRRLVGSFAYLTEDKLLWSASHQYSDDAAEKQEAKRVLRQLREVDLLLLDESGNALYSDLTRVQLDEYTSAMLWRINALMPTLVASNRKPTPGNGPFGWLDQRLDSRCFESAKRVRCSGVDARRESAK